MNPLLYLPIRNTFKLPVNTASKCMPIEILSPNYDHSSFHFLRLPFTSGKFHFLIGANMALIERSPKTRPQNSTKKIGGKTKIEELRPSSFAPFRALPPFRSISHDFPALSPHFPPSAQLVKWLLQSSVFWAMWAKLSSASRLLIALKACWLGEPTKYYVYVH